MGKVRTDTFTYHLRNGFSLTSRSPSIDGLALNEIWLERIYEPKNVGIVFDWKSCRTIVDIGAHIGTFTLYAASRAPEARIIAVEPEPGNISMLKRNVQESNLGNRVRIIEKGIGIRESEHVLHVSDVSSWHHSLYARGDKSHPVTIQLIPLVNLLEREGVTTVDFLKMDCEGAEYDAFYQLPDAMLHAIRFIAMETHHYSPDARHTTESLRAFLEQKGFRIMQIKEHFLFAQRSLAYG
jgi:FkbM family methyltransferase